MYAKPKLPTWPDVATTIARLNLNAKQLLEEAMASGEKREIAACKKLVRNTQKLMDKHGITIRA